MCKIAISIPATPTALSCAKFYPHNGRTVIVIEPAYVVKSMMKDGLEVEMPPTAKLCIYALGWRECRSYDFDTHETTLREGSVWLEMPF